jgi:hypothetical protein
MALSNHTVIDLIDAGQGVKADKVRLSYIAPNLYVLGVWGKTATGQPCRLAVVIPAHTLENELAVAVTAAVNHARQAKMINRRRSDGFG